MKKDCWGNMLVAVFVMMSLCVLPIHAYAQDAWTGSFAATRTEEEEGTRNVTLDFKDADILLVLRLLSLKSGVNIVAGPEVTGQITIRLNDVPWDKALDVVLRTYGYVYERDNNIIRVTTRENLAAEDLVTETFVLNYSTAEEIEDAIAEIISDRGRIKSVTRTNTVIVTDIATNIYKIGEIIKRLDKRTPQVYIDSKIVLTSQTNLDKIGVEWENGIQGGVSAFGAGKQISFPFKADNNDITDHSFVEGTLLFKDFFPGGGSDITTGTLDFDQTTAIINLLKSMSSTKIISNPRIVTLSNQTAKVQVGDEVGIPTFERNDSTGTFEVTGFEMRETGVVLNVTPHVNDANEILVELEPEVTEQGLYQTITASLSAPTFTVTKAKTQVLIRDRETICIGGLVSDSITTSYQHIPVLGKLPIVGRFFRYQEDTGTGGEAAETIFFVTVTIVDTEGQPEYGELA